LPDFCFAQHTKVGGGEYDQMTTKYTEWPLILQMVKIYYIKFFIPRPSRPYKNWDILVCKYTIWQTWSNHLCKIGFSHQVSYQDPNLRLLNLQQLRYHCSRLKLCSN
jgi:hypothetical protein